ncbi:hypothetical protein [Methanoregula boonei]|jgi:hypothetical protein|uniref:hypothetical protein n=1 Tax=Methanoregula boonei TaxID=358766 RepID=UPI0012F77741|nr:hypothetical protein [Methanoregula boonei]
MNWKNWKTGATIGFIYGLICAIYWIPILVMQYFPSSHFPIMQCEDTCSGMYEFIGIILFFPIQFFTFLITVPFYQKITANYLILSYSVIEIMVGTALGAAIGHFFGWLEKSQNEDSA